MTSFSLDFQPLATEPSISVVRVPWDSELLGLTVYELRLDESVLCSPAPIRKWLASLERQISCLVCAKVDEREVAALECLAQCGFYPVETTVQATIDLSGGYEACHAPDTPVKLRRATETDTEALRNIASKAFWADRFHLDPNLSNEAADARYAHWIEQALSDDEMVFAYEHEGFELPIGFYLIRPIAEEAVDLNLVAMDPAHSGQGLGPALYSMVLYECALMGFSAARTHIVTRNLPALNILARLGFTFRNTTTSMHRFSQGRDRIE